MKDFSPWWDWVPRSQCLLKLLGWIHSNIELICSSCAILFTLDIKNKEVLVSNNRGKLKVNILSVFWATCHSWTWHSYVIRVRLGTSYIRHFSSMGLGNLFASYLITNFCQHDLWSYLSQMLPHFGVVSPICLREFLFVKHPLLIWPPLLQSRITPIIFRYMLFHVDDVGIIMALVRWITSCRLQLII